MKKFLAALLCVIFSCSTARAAQDNQPKVVFAVESELMSVDGEVSNIWARPFVYENTTYIPLANAVRGMGGSVEFDPSSRMIYAAYNNNTYSVSLDDPSVRVFNDTSFAPIRNVCNSLGFKVEWYDGIISIDTDNTTLTGEEVSYYKDKLAYIGFYDEFFRPRYVVNPYVKYSYEQMNSDINMLARLYPDLFYVYSIGKTSEGRDLTAFTMGKGDTKIVLCASMHAREHIATNFVMYLADSYAYGYAQNLERDGYSFRNLLDNYKFIVVPMVNPDGINLVQNGFDSTQNPEFVKGLNTNSYGHRGWKATATGVDLNNNFDWLWYPKGDGPSFSGYGGPYAASEPETRAMQDLINDTDFKVFTSFHTQGQVVYWMDPNCDQSLVDKFEPHIDRICEETGFEKMPSDGSVGYSGYMADYIRYYKQAMAMTIELCPYVGDYPYPESDFDSVAWPMRNIGFILADIAKSL